MYTYRKRTVLHFDVASIISIILGLATLGNCAVGKRSKDCQMISTENGNCGGGVCVLPFIYKTKIVFDTSDMDYLKKDQLWCSCTQNYDLDQSWGEASKCTNMDIGCNYTTYTKTASEGTRVTSPGADCTFPFTYTPTSGTQPITFYECTNIDYPNKNRKWCSTTSDFDKDKLWGECTNECGSKTKFCDLDTASALRVACKTSITATGDEARFKCNEAGCCYNPVGSPACFEKQTRVIDECTLGYDDCDDNADCEDLTTDYKCTCKTGYSGDGKTCTDINECDSITCTDGSCQNSGGSYKCVCQSGYAAGTDNVCKDIDECATGDNKCDRNAECTNTEGSYTCKCNSAYTGDGFTCGCAEWKYLQMDSKFSQGGTLISSGTTADICKSTCNSVDACASFDSHEDDSGMNCYWFESKMALLMDASSCSDTKHTHYKKYCGQDTSEVICADTTCGTNFECIENSGSTKCVCKSGYQLNNGECISSSTITCADNPCDSNAACSGTGTDYTCTCNSGYQKDSTKQTCVDINECTANTFTCQSNSQCSNTEGSYVCNCDSGFILVDSVCKETSGVTCSDNPCDSNQDCSESGNEVTCTCKSGFELDATTKKCVSTVKTCADDPCGNNAICTTSGNTYTCSCKTGYEDLKQTNTCSDKNECSDNPCQANSECANTEGSYRCTCNSGYTLQNNECQQDSTGQTCSDNPCGANADCADSGSTFTCTCKSGYEKVGTTNACSDIDECSLSACGGSATCTNTAGSFTCTCPSGSTYENNQCTSCFEEFTFTQVLGGEEKSEFKSLADCQTGCLAESQSVCASFDYVPEKQRCFFHDAAGYQDDEFKTADWNISHYKRVACFTAASK